MRDMKPAERENYVKNELKKRDEIRTRISSLGKLREQYVTKEKKKQAGETNTIDEALVKSVRKQASGKNYQFAE